MTLFSCSITCPIFELKSVDVKALLVVLNNSTWFIELWLSDTQAIYVILPYPESNVVQKVDIDRLIFLIRLKNKI